MGKPSWRYKISVHQHQQFRHLLCWHFGTDLFWNFLFHSQITNINSGIKCYMSLVLPSKDYWICCTTLHVWGKNIARTFTWKLNCERLLPMATTCSNCGHLFLCKVFHSTYSLQNDPSLTIASRERSNIFVLPKLQTCHHIE